MEIKSTKDNIIFLKADNQYELTSTFMRMQEHYESPKFRGKYILLEEYMDWYAKEYGNFTYTSDWSGFNVPGNVVRRFFKMHQSSLLFKELALYSLLEEWIVSKDKFYVIGAYTDDHVVDHEFAHAFFYIDPSYKRTMSELVKELPDKFRNHISDVLVQKGYHTSVIIDETQAYLSTNTMLDTDKMFDPTGNRVPWQNVLEFQKAFYKSYEEYKEDGDG